MYRFYGAGVIHLAAHDEARFLQVIDASEAAGVVTLDIERAKMDCSLVGALLHLTALPNSGVV